MPPPSSARSRPFDWRNFEAMSSPITTHVLDTATGRPAVGVPAVLEVAEKSGIFRRIGAGATNDDGRIRDLLAPGALTPGNYRLTFAVQAYFLARGQKAFYQAIPIEFTVEATDQHYHVPLLLSPFGYSTYRGS